MAKSSEHAAGPFMASAFRVPTSRQVWGTEYIKTGKDSSEFASDLQVWHMSYLKSTLGVKRNHYKVGCSEGVWS
eukprot:1120094-Pelagomonas_calceolata.AAC.1